MIDLIEIVLLLYIILLIRQVFKIFESMTTYIRIALEIQSKSIFEALKRYDSRWKK